MTRRKKPKVKLRVPNPEAPPKGRLQVPAHKVHRSKKQYRRRPKHDRAEDAEAL
jgi:hypothetical protein